MISGWPLMARIRTIKPEFYRHEILQELEIHHAGQYPMLVFSALLGHCDSKGRFRWEPRQLKLDILPFINFDMQETLSLLHQSGMVMQYSVKGTFYGVIPSFNKHQRLSGKELTEGEKHPEPNGEAIGKHQRTAVYAHKSVMSLISQDEAVGKQLGSVQDESEAQEGKGREGKRKGIKGSLASGGLVDAPSGLIPPVGDVVKDGSLEDRNLTEDDLAGLGRSA